MKAVYPVLLKKEYEGYLVYVPDFNAYTQGKDIYDAMFMARDLIGTISLSLNKMPIPSTKEQAIRIAKEKADDKDISILSSGDIILIDIDTKEYEKKLDTRAVKKNVTIPAWLNEKAEKAGVNFSRILQDALIQKLDE